MLGEQRVAQVRTVGILVIVVDAVETIAVDDRRHLLGEVTGTQVAELRQTGFVVVAQDAEDDLDAPLAERLDDLVIVVQDVLALRVREDIDLALLPIVVDVVGEEHHIIEQQPAVFGLEAQGVERVGIIDLEETNDALLAFLAGGAALPGHVADQVDQMALILGGLDAVRGNHGLQREEVGRLFLGVKRLQGDVQGVGTGLVRSDDDLAAVLDGELVLRIELEGRPMLLVVGIQVGRIVFHLHVHALLRSTSEGDGDGSLVSVLPEIDDIADLVGLAVAQRCHEVLDVGVSAFVDMVDDDVIGARGQGETQAQGGSEIMYLFHVHSSLGLIFGKADFGPLGRVVQGQVVAIGAVVLEGRTASVVHLPVGNQAFGSRVDEIEMVRRLDLGLAQAAVPDTDL